MRRMLGNSTWQQNIWEDLDEVQEEFLLKLKESGKELDPRYFNEDKKNAFAKSDAAEWEQWINNQMVGELITFDDTRSR